MAAQALFWEPKELCSHSSSLSWLWRFPHEDVKEAIQSLALLLDYQDLALLAEDSGEVALDEEAVIVVTVDQPVASPPLARIVFELGAEDREVEVSARPHKAQHAVEVERPVSLLDVMEYPAVYQRVKTAWLQGRYEGIAHQEPDPWSETLLTCPMRDRPEG